MESTQNKPKLVLMSGLYSRFGTCQKELFQPFVFEILNHTNSVTYSVTHFKREESVDYEYPPYNDR